MKKIMSFLLAVSMVITCCNFNITYAAEDETDISEQTEIAEQAESLEEMVSAAQAADTAGIELLTADDVVEIGGTESKGSSETILDLGRPYRIEYITCSKTTSNVLVSNDESFGAASVSSKLVNVALGKKITSTRYGGGGYLTNVSTKANDGDTATAFISTPVNYTDEDGLTIDLDGDYKIEYIQVNSDNRRPRKVYVSNTEDFSDAVEISEASAGKYSLADGNTYKYARVDFKAADSDANNHFYVYEIEVYSYLTSENVPPMTAQLVKSGDKYVLNGSDANQYYRYIKADGGKPYSKQDITVYTNTASTEFSNFVTGDNISMSGSLSLYSSGLPLSNLGDGSSDTICAIMGVNPYVQVDLGSEKNISHIEIILRRDILDDRDDLIVLASNDEAFTSYTVIGQQMYGESFAQKAELVRVNNNPYEGYRYVRFYAGKSKGFLALAEVKVFAKDIETEYTDALYNAPARAEEKPEIAYRITDNDLKSKWYGDTVTLDMGYCRDISEIFVSGEGEMNIRLYCENDEVMWDTCTLIKDEVKSFVCNGKGRYVEIEAINGYVDIYDMKAYSVADKQIKQEEEIDIDGEWYTADFGEIRLISEILPCNWVYYVSSDPEFKTSLEVTGHLHTPVSGRYIRTKSEVETLGILTYELPQINLDSGEVIYDTDIYNKSETQKNIIAKYNDNGGLVMAEISDMSSGALQTNNVSFDSSKFMVWESVESQKPLIPVLGIEKVKTQPGMEIYVAKNGSDENDGSKTKPFATIERAQEAVRESNFDMEGDIIVHIGEGIYNISKPLEFTVQDSGDNGYNVIYQGEGADKTSISGGVAVTNFTDNGNGLWTAYLPDIDEAYSLTVNGTAAEIAHTESAVTPAGAFSHGTGYEFDGFRFDKTKLPMLTNPEDVFIHATKSWIDVFIRAADMWEESNGYYLEIYPNYLNQALNYDKMSTLPLSALDSYEIVNAFELLDSPGEFYFNKKTHMLYYMPRSGESISNVYAEVPVLEDLVSIHGNGINKHIENLVLDGIKFENSIDPNRYRFGMITDQAQIVRAGTYNNDMIGGTISLDYATNVSIRNCEITNVEKGAIAFGEGVVGSEIKDNKIHNIGDGAVVVGKNYHNKIERRDEDTSKQFDCNKRKPAWSSSGDTKAISMNKIWDMISEVRSYAWYSENSDIIRGIKPWYAIDLMKPYTISQIELYFPSAQKNFEVIAANNADFTDGVVLGSVGSSSCYSKIISGNGDNKYRYLKISKTALEAFGISGIYVRTPDEPYQSNVEEACDGNVIENNYIAYTGLKHKAAPAITLFYTANTKIVNNSIFESNYSAISCGWGWEFNTDSTTNKNILIANNHIKNFNLTAADGGGVYIMGNQPGTIVEGNYIEQTTLPIQDYTNTGLYGESGLRFSVFRNNVIEVPERGSARSNYAIAFFQTNEEDCQVHNNYATYKTVFDGSGEGSRIERPVSYDIGNKPSDVKSIINNSGCSLE